MKLGNAARPSHSRINKMASLGPVLVALGVLTIAVYLIRRYFQGGVCRSNRRLDGKTVIITGGNGGIGKETAIDLAKRGARVIIGCRDLKRGNAAVKEIQECSGSQQVFMEQIDLASLTSIRRFAENIMKNERRLDVLINNAGVMWCPFQRTTDGFEMQFGVNHLGHFLLTNLLLDLLKRSAPSRIVTVSSIAHIRPPGIDIFNTWNKEETYNYRNAYSWGKLANILFMRELAKKLEGTRVTTFSLHPGVVDTDLLIQFPGYRYFRFVLDPLTRIFFKSPSQGAQTSIYCAVSEELEGESGLYYSDCAVKKPSKAAQDDELAKKLWDVSMDLVKL